MQRHRQLSYALSILSGAHEFDVVASIDTALDAFMESLRGFNQTYEQLRSRRLNRTKAHSLVIELAQAGAFASSDILPVVREFENPRHAEFRERNAWNLYQDCTEIMKNQSPPRQCDGFKALNQVMTAALN